MKKLILGLLLANTCAAQTTIQVPVPAKTYTVPVPAQPVPAYTQTGQGWSLTVQPPPVPATTVTFTAPAYTVPYTPAVPVPPIAAVPALIGPNAGSAAPASCMTTAAPVGAWSIVGGVVDFNGASFGPTSGVVLGVCSPAVFYQENASCLWWSAAGTPSAPVWNATLAPSGIVVPKCPAGAGTFGIKASGAKLVSTLDGSQVTLVGTDASGLANGGPSQWAPFANSTPAFWQSVKNYQGSGINVIRLDLNSAYWVGYACGQSTATYQSTVQSVVNMITQAGMYAIIDLHWDAPGSTCPIGQGGFPSTNATAFWKSAADTFGKNPAVIFELFNEPFGANLSTEWVNWAVSPPAPGPSIAYLTNGGTYTPFVAQNNANGGNNALLTTNIGYTVPSEISLLKTIRGEGATNLVLASSGTWNSDIETWLATYTLNGNPDPLKNFGAAWHDYGWGAGAAYPLAVLAAGYPLIITETYGFDANLNGTPNATTGAAFAASQGIGWLCWGTINDWGGQQTLSLASTPPMAGCM